MLPERFRPQIYDYFEDTKAGQEYENNDCTICMNVLTGDPQETGSLNNPRVMHAPCGHRFHEECLMRWMTVKMECPTCRAALPEIP